MPGDTVHGYNLDKPDSIEINESIVNAAVYLRAPVIVIHCSSFTFDPARYDERRKKLQKTVSVIEELSRKSGVKFAVENVLPGVATDLAEDIIRSSNPNT